MATLNSLLIAPLKKFVQVIGILWYIGLTSLYVTCLFYLIKYCYLQNVAAKIA